MKKVFSLCIALFCLISCSTETIVQRAEKQALATLKEFAVNPKSVSIENIDIIDSRENIKSAGDSVLTYSYCAMNFDGYGANVFGAELKKRYEYIYLEIRDKKGHCQIKDIYYIIDSPLSNEKVEESIIQRLNRHSEQDIKQKGLSLGYYAVKTALYSPHIIQEY